MDVERDGGAAGESGGGTGEDGKGRLEVGGTDGRGGETGAGAGGGDGVAEEVSTRAVMNALKVRLLVAAAGILAG